MTHVDFEGGFGYSEPRTLEERLVAEQKKSALYESTMLVMESKLEKLMITVNAVAGGAAQGLMLHSKIMNAYEKGRQDERLIWEEKERLDVSEEAPIEN